MTGWRRLVNGYLLPACHVDLHTDLGNYGTLGAIATVQCSGPAARAILSSTVVAYQEGTSPFCT